MNINKMALCLIVGWGGAQAVAAYAVTPAASAVGGSDALVDTRLNSGACSGTADAVVDTRLNFVARSAAPGAKVDTLTPCGTVIMVR